MEYIFFLLGVVVGSIITQVLVRWKTGYGWFRVIPVEDPEEPGLHTINVMLIPDQNLLNVKQIVLKRDNSQQ